LEQTQDGTEHERLLKEIEDFEMGGKSNRLEPQQKVSNRQAVTTDRDDLRFRSIAAYKAIKGGDVEFF
jgi:hypothetical protein